MYTSHNKSYADLMRSTNKKRLERLASRAISPPPEKRADGDDTESHASEEYPEFVDPTEPRDFCVDPIVVLNIPRSQYRNTRELALCKRQITRLHTNVQFLENLDTLVLCNNRISDVSFLLPPRRTADRTPSSQNGNCAGDRVEMLWCRPRGCRHLRRLFLSHNLLRSLDGDIPRLRRLTVLLLAYNQLTNLVAVSAQLKHLRELRELDLRGNPLCDELGYRPYLIYEQTQLELLDRRLVEMEERNTVVEQLVEKRKEFDSVCEPGITIGPSTPRQRHSLESSKPLLSARLSPLLNMGAQTLPAETNVDPRYFSVTVGKETLLKTFAFFKTFTPARGKADDTNGTSRGFFRPSACELHLEKTMQRLGKSKLLRETREAQMAEAKWGELVDAHKAFHAVWAMSGRGMPLSAERYGALTKQQEASPNMNSFEHTNVSPRTNLMRKRASVAKQPTPDGVAKGSAKQPVPPPVVSLDQTELPALPSQLPGGTDHCVMYDALLRREDLVEKRIWGKPHCLPSPRRLDRLSNLLSKSGNFVNSNSKKIALGTSGVAFEHHRLLREIQQCKDCAIPEPWEGNKSAETIAVVRDRQEFLFNAMVAMLLPSELSTIESHLMAGVSDSLPAVESQRGKKSARKDKRVSNEAARPTGGAGAILVQGLASGSPAQRTSFTVAATNVELGPPDRSTVRRLLNMLDYDSGLSQISIDKLTSAYASAYASGRAETPAPPTSETDDKTASSFTESKRQHRSPAGGRSRGERRGGKKTSLIRSESRHVAREAPSSSITKPVTLTLNTALLDLMLYLPFVKCRLAYLKGECEVAAKDMGELGDSLPGRFAKYQAVSWYYEKLQQAVQISGMTEENAESHFVDVEGLLKANVHEVGSYFSSS